MQLSANSKHFDDAMILHGTDGLIFSTFSSKKAFSENSRNDYTQSVSENFGRFSFTGKERDEETGYGYFGARYMDHELMTSFTVLAQLRYE